MQIFTDPIFILETVGLIGLFCIIFAESGLFIGFFLPGDSILFAAGLLASQGFYPLYVLIGNIQCREIDMVALFQFS